MKSPGESHTQVAVVGAELETSSPVSEAHALTAMLLLSADASAVGAGGAVIC